jgi:predicted phage-related endonuclease
MDARARFLEERRSGLGGSDAAVVIVPELVPWKTPLQLYLEKRGEIPEPDLDELEHIHWGRELEAHIAKRYSTKTGHKLDPDPRAVLAGLQGEDDAVELLRHSEHPYIFGHRDYHILPSNGDGSGTLECKNVGFFNKDQWVLAGEAPVPYQIQMQQYLACSGDEWGAFAFLVGGNDFAYYTIHRQDRFIKLKLIPTLKEFWERVQNGDPPAVGSRDHDALALLYPEERGATAINLPDDAVDWDLERQGAAEDVKAAEERKALATNKLKNAMRDATYGLLPDGTCYKWKTVRKQMPAKEAHEQVYRGFRHLKKLPKEGVIADAKARGTASKVK